MPTAHVNDVELYYEVTGTGDRLVLTPTHLVGNSYGAAMLAASEAPMAAVAELLEAGEHRAAAERFVDDVALGPGAWEQSPASFRDVLVANAPTFLDEHRDPTALTIDTDALSGRPSRS